MNVDVIQQENSAIEIIQKGDTGLSAYQIAVLHGYEGTEEEYAIGETERVTAEGLRVTAEDLRVTAESNRESAETTRGNNESTRQSNENERVNAENDRDDAEQIRISTEEAIVIAEGLRVTAENARVSAEGLRVTADQARSTAEGLRVTADQDRSTAEGLRVTAENARVSAEGLRVTADQARSTAEGLRVTAESARATAEGLRVSAEQGRVTVESARVTAEGLRVTAEQSRVTAESLRVTAESARGTAEYLRVTAESARLTAEALRVTAENARVALGIAQLPQGTWNALTNTPTLSSNQVGASAGWWYMVAVAGNGYIEGDINFYNGTNWVKIPKTFLLANNSWQTAYDFVGNLLNLFQISKENTLRFGVPVELNSLFHVLNAGLNNIVDIPVNALSSAGTEHGVKIVVGGVEIGRFSALSDGSGGVYAALATIQNLLEGYQTTATAGGTTTLTGLSAYNQYFTGSANQTVLLPVVTTLKNGLSYWFTNSSTGTITVQSSGGNAIVVMAAGTTATFSCINISGGTGTASWSYWYEGVTVASGKKLGVSNSLTLAGPDGTTQTFQASDTIVGRGTTDTLTNKRITARTPTVTQAAAPVINTDNTDQVHIIGLAQAITSMTTNLTGTPSAGDQLWFDITDNGTGRLITWGPKFEASGSITLPTTTVAGVRLDAGFAWNPVTSAWRIISKS